jgi:hypothetical protein
MNLLRAVEGSSTALWNAASPGNPRIDAECRLGLGLRLGLGARSGRSCGSTGSPKPGRANAQALGGGMRQVGILPHSGVDHHAIPQRTIAGADWPILRGVSRVLDRSGRSRRTSLSSIQGGTTEAWWRWRAGERGSRPPGLGLVHVHLDVDDEGVKTACRLSPQASRDASRMTWPGGIETEVSIRLNRLPPKHHVDIEPADREAFLRITRKAPRNGARGTGPVRIATAAHPSMKGPRRSGSGKDWKFMISARKPGS